MHQALYLVGMLCLSLNCFSMGPKINWDLAIDRAIEQYGLPAEPKIKSFFSKANIQYPPQEVALLAFKAEKKIELWAKDSNKDWTFIHHYPLTGYSGRLGPKLKENDMQIPEGIYQLVAFNPFSSWHLSMKINYPNQFDQQKAHIEGRRKPGNNIFIHGKNLSVGCLAVGNQAIDQLFVLARRVGLKNIQLIISPNDLRYQKAKTASVQQPKWLPELYYKIRVALKPFKNRPVNVA